MANTYAHKLKNRIDQIIKSYIEAACSQIKIEMSRYYLNIEGEVNIEDEVKTTQQVATAIIRVWGQAAWIIEHGKGSLMDSERDNTYLQEYMGSNLWNPSRDGKSITGRPKGVYQDIDGKEHYSSGLMEGRNLENKRSRNHEHIYKPLKGKHVIQQILFGSEEDMEDYRFGNGLIRQMMLEIFKVTNETLKEVLVKSFPKAIKIARR